MMMPGVRRIAWDVPTESIPAFLTIVMVPLTVSITDGIAFGLISYAALKLATGRAGEVHWLVYLFALLLALRYASSCDSTLYPLPVPGTRYSVLGTREWPGRRLGLVGSEAALRSEYREPSTEPNN
jgi:hypothetical protein